MTVTAIEGGPGGQVEVTSIERANILRDTG